MNVRVAGLGLIGGSLAKAYRSENHTVYGYDIDESIFGFAKLSGAINGLLDASTLKLCDILLVAVNPKDAAEYMEKSSPHIDKHTLVIDCCGVKRYICGKCFPLAAQYGFTFVGGHPMAGSHKGGFKNSRENLFRGASMILVPPVFDDASLFGKIEELLKPAGFGSLTFTTAEKHDEMIAFSSQMAHVVSNAFIKSPSAGGHKGFSAGSYKDLTRVAQLNAQMWTELFMKNSDNLTHELDIFIKEISRYREALADKNEAKMTELLIEGSNIKEKLDK